MIKRERALKHINFTATTTVINITSIDTNARNGSTPNLLNWNKFIAIKHEYSRGRLAQWKSVRFVKIFVTGPRFETRRRGFLFRCYNINSQCMFDGIFHPIRRVLPISQPRLGKSCMRQIYYCMKRNVALEIGPMTSHLRSGMTTYIYSTMQIYNDTSNLERYLYALYSLRLETNRDD